MNRVLVNIGCGFSTGESWLNYDASPTLWFERIPVIGRLYTKNTTRFPAIAMYGDITKRPLSKPNTADAIYSSHMLEHVSYVDMQKSLRNIHTMLKSGGVFRVVVPDLESRIKAYEQKSCDPQRSQKFMTWTGLGTLESSSSIGARLLRSIGNKGHLWMYDKEGLILELENAGFCRVRNCSYGDAELEAFKEVEDRERFESEFGPELALECFKP